MTGSRVHRIWTTMKQRCCNPKSKAFGYYGGRGITVHPEWAISFEAFLRDMGEPPTENHTIDRIDNDGNYEPGNCRWVTQAEQMKNTRRCRPITFNGRTMLLSEWAEEIGVSCQTLIWRIRKYGVNDSLTFVKGSRHGKAITFNGQTKSLANWARELGVQRLTLYYRIKSCGIEKAFAMPPPATKGA